MFTVSGLSNLGDSRWQRALLSIGDYFLPSGRNRSFLVNAATEPASWKRLLRGSGLHVPEKRPLLKQLWDRLTTDRPFKQQLDEIIAQAHGLKPWIDAFVRTPQAIEYCGRQSVRWNSEIEIYLLSSSQMNGYHAELYSFCFFDRALRKLAADGSLEPLKLSQYHSVKGTDEEPYILLNFDHGKRHLAFWIEFKNANFHLRIDRAALDQVPEIQAFLCAQGGY